MTNLNLRLNVANRAYSDAWAATREMAAAKVVMGPPHKVGPFKLFAVYPAFTRDQIAASAARCNRMFRAIKRYRDASKGGR